MSDTGRAWGRVNLSGFMHANAGRTAIAARRDVGIAATALGAWNSTWPESWRQIATARTEDPDASWAQIGRRVGLTKDQAVARFARLRKAADTPQGSPR